MSPRPRRPAPCEYAAEPWQFGRGEVSAWSVPDGGDDRAVWLAQAQHELARAIDRVGDRSAAAAIAAQAQISVQAWSHYRLGKGWMNERAIASAALFLAKRLADAEQRANT